MKKLMTYSLAALLLIASASSCNTYRSLNSATSIGSLSGNPFMQNVAKSVLRNMANTLIQNGINNVAGKLNLGSSLSSILTTVQAVNGFKNMLSSTYNIAGSTVDNNYDGFGTIKDVVGFVAKNGSGFNF